MTNLESTRKSAIILIAHGSRRPQANQELLQLADILRSRLPAEVIFPAFLEIATPSIPDAARSAVEHGATSVRMLPFFLSPGNHVTEDLEAFRRDFEQQFPSVSFDLCPPLGLHPFVVDALLDRLDQTLKTS